MKGIIELAEMLADQLDDDDNFTATSYTGSPIIKAEFIAFSRTTRLKTEQHPNLFRKLVLMNYLRVRSRNEGVAMRSFLMAVKEKILSKPILRDQFIDQIIFVDDENEPQFYEGISLSKPILGIHDSEQMTRVRTGGQREENIRVELWLYSQRFSKNVSEIITGD